MQISRDFMMPPVVKNLLILNVLVFLATYLLPAWIGNAIFNFGALQFWAGGDFRIWQLVTYMFLHSGFAHIFFNMFALWMFGRVLELEMGSKRFITYYLICGIGAGLVQLGVNWIEFASAVSGGVSSMIYGYAHASTVGASGAVFGLLLAFGMLHPNERIMLMFPPVAMKAKWFVIIYGAIELLSGIGPSSSIAHFAHLGGMLFGWLLILYWKKKRIIY